MEILVLGNCQARGLAHALELYLPGSRAEALEINSDPVRLEKGLRIATTKKTELLLVHESVLRVMETHKSVIGALPDTAIVVPTITFSAFHPDTQIAYSGERRCNNGLGGGWNSRIVLWAFQNRLSREDTRRLFRRDVYEALGYFDEWTSSVSALKDAFERTALDFTRWIRRNQRTGIFMHGINHPLALALAALAEQVAEKEYPGRTRVVSGIERYLTDHLANVVWPVYPEIASTLGVRGDYLWRHGNRLVNLEEFIDLTFSLWESADDWRRGNCRFIPPLSESAKCALDLAA